MAKEPPEYTGADAIRKTPRTNLTLSLRTRALLEKMRADGRYPSWSEAVTEAVDLLAAKLRIDVTDEEIGEQKATRPKREG